MALAIREMDLDKVTVNLVKTVAEAHPNLGITSLTGSVDVAAVNVPLRLSVTVRNYGDPVYLAQSAWWLARAQRDWPKIEFLATKERH